MAVATHEEIFNCSPEKFFSVVTDYSSYPKFLQEVKGMSVIQSEGNRKLVEYSVHMMKSFKYQLWMTETPNSQVSWEFAGGDLFKSSKGYWKIEAHGSNQTKATYHVDVTFNLLVPGPIAKALVNVNLPTMMKAYHKRLAEV